MRGHARQIFFNSGARNLKMQARNTKIPTTPPIIAPTGKLENKSPDTETGVVTLTTDGFCTTRVPLGSPFLFRLLLSTVWSLM